MKTSTELKTKLTRKWSSLLLKRYWAGLPPLAIWSINVLRKTSHWKLQEGSCWDGNECFHIKIMGFGQTENPEQHHCWITLWLGDHQIVMFLSAMPQDTGSLQVYLGLTILSWWLLWVWLNLKMNLQECRWQNHEQTFGLNTSYKTANSKYQQNGIHGATL